MIIRIYSRQHMVAMDTTCAIINKLNDYRLGKTCFVGERFNTSDRHLYEKNNNSCGFQLALVCDGLLRRGFFDSLQCERVITTQIMNLTVVTIWVRFT